MKSRIYPTEEEWRKLMEPIENIVFTGVSHQVFQDGDEISDGWMISVRAHYQEGPRIEDVHLNNVRAFGRGRSIPDAYKNAIEEFWVRVHEEYAERMKVKERKAKEKAKLKAAMDLSFEDLFGGKE